MILIQITPRAFLVFIFLDIVALINSFLMSFAFSFHHDVAHGCANV